MSAPDWRAVFADVLRTPVPGGSLTEIAENILAAIAERGYRLHRDHSFPGPNQPCERCGAIYGGIAAIMSCEAA
jgi:hypothetical protein